MSYELETPIWDTMGSSSTITEIDSDGDMRIDVEDLFRSFTLYFDARDVYEMLKDYFED